MRSNEGELQPHRAQLRKNTSEAFTLLQHSILAPDDPWKTHTRTWNLSTPGSMLPQRMCLASSVHHRTQRGSLPPVYPPCLHGSRNPKGPPFFPAAGVEHSLSSLPNPPILRIPPRTCCMEASSSTACCHPTPPF